MSDLEKENRYIFNHNEIINNKYQFITQLGKGVFGNVYEVSTKEENEKYALKIIRNEKRFHKQAQIEIKILNDIKSNEKNCIKLIEDFLYNGHICLLFDICGKNLYEILKNNNFEGFDINTINIIVKQLGICFDYLNKKRIVHGDVKPENILINGTKITVIDFGSACYVHNRIHSYIQSRYYRAPEIILGINYNSMIDIWSIGCILYELFTGKPLFPSKNEYELFASQLIINKNIPIEMIDNSQRQKDLFYLENNNYKLYSEINKYYVKNYNNYNIKLDNITNEKLLNLIKSCIIWDQNKRIKPKEIIKLYEN